MITKQKKSNIQSNSKAISNNLVQQKSEMKQGLSIQDNREESMNNKALQKHCDFCTQKKTIQRLKIYPEKNAGSETDFESEPEVIDFNTCNYETLSAYRDDRFKQQTQFELNEGDFNKFKTTKGIYQPTYYFEDGDTEKLDKLINDYEEGKNGKEKVKTIICNEGQIKVAKPDQSATFGGLSSCITITVYMENGIKVLAHLGLFAPVPLSSIKKVIDLQKSTIDGIMVSGVLGLWPENLVPFSSDKSLKTDIEGFKDYVKSQLGGSKVTVEDFEGTKTVDNVSYDMTQKRIKIKMVDEWLNSGKIDKQEARTYKVMILHGDDISQSLV